MWFLKGILKGLLLDSLVFVVNLYPGWGCTFVVIFFGLCTENVVIGVGQGYFTATKSWPNSPPQIPTPIYKVFSEHQEMMVDLKGYEVLSRNSAINGKALHQALPLIKVGWSWAISWDPSPCCQKCLDEAHHWGSKLELFQVQWVSLCEPQSWATGSLVAPCEETCKVPICAQCGLQPPDWQGVPGAQGNLEKGCAEEDWSWQVFEKDQEGQPLEKGFLEKGQPKQEESSWQQHRHLEKE